MSKFGSQILSKMLRIDWQAQEGWSKPCVLPCSNIEISPAAQVLHYGQAVFEGIRAFKQATGTYAIFRPDENALRFQRSCARMAMPELPIDTFVMAVEEAVRANLAEWGVDTHSPASIYLRPFMYATESSLGFYGRSTQFSFFVLALAMQQYFGGQKMLRVLVEDRFSRAYPRGVGAAKCAGNYAGTILAQEAATLRDCDQVLWLDGPEQTWIEDFSTSNVFFAIDGELVTPSLNDSFLAGITRASLLELSKPLGIRSSERRISIHEIVTAIKGKRMVECFSCGTTASVAPVGLLIYKDQEYHLGSSPGPITEVLRSELLAIQTGASDRQTSWRHPVRP